MPRKELLDPQGKATILGLKNLGFDSIDQLRIGKRISLEIDAENRQKAEEQVKDACEKLLHNPIMEEYEFSLAELS